MARRALALALVIAALVLTAAGCGLGDPGPAAGHPAPPLVTHPFRGPDGTPGGPGGGHGVTPAPACVEPDDVTAVLPPSSSHRAGSDRPVQIVPRCSELEVPVPFTVPDHHAGERLDSV